VWTRVTVSVLVFSSRQSWVLFRYSSGSPEGHLVRFSFDVWETLTLPISWHMMLADDSYPVRGTHWLTWRPDCYDLFWYEYTCAPCPHSALQTQCHFARYFQRGSPMTNKAVFFGGKLLPEDSDLSGVNGFVFLQQQDISILDRLLTTVKINVPTRFVCILPRGSGPSEAITLAHLETSPIQWDLILISNKESFIVDPISITENKTNLLFQWLGIRTSWYPAGDRF